MDIRGAIITGKSRLCWILQYVNDVYVIWFAGLSFEIHCLNHIYISGRNDKIETTGQLNGVIYNNSDLKVKEASWSDWHFTDKTNADVSRDADVWRQTEVKDPTYRFSDAFTDRLHYEGGQEAAHIHH